MRFKKENSNLKNIGRVFCYTVILSLFSFSVFAKTALVREVDFGKLKNPKAFSQALLEYYDSGMANPALFEKAREMIASDGKPTPITSGNLFQTAKLEMARVDGKIQLDDTTRKKVVETLERILSGATIATSVSDATLAVGFYTTLAILKEFPTHIQIVEKLIAGSLEMAKANGGKQVFPISQLEVIHRDTALDVIEEVVLGPESLEVTTTSTGDYTDGELKAIYEATNESFEEYYIAFKKTRNDLLGDYSTSNPAIVLFNNIVTARFDHVVGVTPEGENITYLDAIVRDIKADLMRKKTDEGSIATVSSLAAYTQKAIEEAEKKEVDPYKKQTGECVFGLAAGL